MQGTFTAQDKIRVRGNVVLYYIMSFNFDNGKEQCLERSVLLIFKLNKRVDWCLLLSVQLWNISTLCLSKMNSKKPPRGKIVRECRCMMISITRGRHTETDRWCIHLFSDCWEEVDPLQTARSSLFVDRFNFNPRETCNTKWHVSYRDSN